MTFLPPCFLLSSFIRNYSVLAKSKIKRFYDRVHVEKTDTGRFQILLDEKKLRTKGCVNSKLYALMLADEWNCQGEFLSESTMHLTALAAATTLPFQDRQEHRRACLDRLKSFLVGDVILYRSCNPSSLFKRQCELWDPVLCWFNSKYKTSLSSSTDINFTNECVSLPREIMEMPDDGRLVALEKIAATLSSTILALATVDRYLTVENAVELALLEMNYQSNLYGNVEWYHDVEKATITSIIAASMREKWRLKRQRRLKRKRRKMRQRSK